MKLPEFLPVMRAASVAVMPNDHVPFVAFRIVKLYSNVYPPSIEETVDMAPLWTARVPFG